MKGSADPRDLPPRLVLRAPAGQYLWFLLLAAICVGLAYWAATTCDDSVVRVYGWVGVAFFGCGFGVILVHCYPWRRIVIDGRGVEALGWRFGVIEWVDIVSIRVAETECGTFLCVELRDPAKYTSRLTKRGRSRMALYQECAEDAVALALPFPGMPPSAVDVRDYLRRHHAARTDTGP